MQQRTAPPATEAPRTPRWPRILRRSAIVFVVVVAVAYAGVGWYVSGEIMEGLTVNRSPVEYDTDVLSLTDDEITVVPPTDEAEVEWDRDAVMGLRWEGGYGQVGPTTLFQDGVETRPFMLLEGSPPPLGENVADFDPFAFPEDPALIGLEYDTVTYPSPLGDLEAWYLPGEGSTWIIGVHGRAADRTEFLRLVSSIDDLDYPTLLVRYRNDEDSPQTGDSLILAGQTEWEDVAAAVDYARSRGATDFVVAGMSMGGGLTLGYAVNAEPGLIRGLILEAPAADVREVVQLRSGEALPIGGPIGDSILAVGRTVTWLRTGVDFDEIDYVDRADELDMPILLFHGTEDGTIPVEISENLAAARPDLVESHILNDTTHVRAWNEDPEAYSDLVKEFLTEG